MLFQLVKIANWFSFLNAFCLVVVWRNFTEAFLFFLYVRKDQVHEQSGCKLWFAITSRRMIIYTGSKTFLIAIMSVFRNKLYIQHLSSLFRFLLTILSNLSLTKFPLNHQLSNKCRAASSSNKRPTSKRSFCKKPVHYLTLIKIKTTKDK